ncbi:MAG: MATE family efflux transporter [Acinetobacter sp.]
MQWEKLGLGWTKRILKLGFPIGLAVFFEVSIFSTGTNCPQSIRGKCNCSTQIAISVTSQLFMIPLCVSDSLNHSGWHVLWRKNWLAMRQVQKVGLISATIFAAFTMALIAASPSLYRGVYANDVHIMPIAMYLLWFAMAYQLVDGWQVSAAGCLRGMQDTRAPICGLP